MRIRVSLWMTLGAALGLPVDDLVEAINLQLINAKRVLKGRRVSMTVTERIRQAHLAKRLGAPFKELFSWIVSPDSLIRWLKRHQERRAHARAQPKKRGRPWLSSDKEAEILRIYRSGLTGIERIVGELKKCRITVAKSTVRKVLDRHGLPPTDSNRQCGSTWAQFWTRHAPHLVGVDFIPVPVGLLGKIAYHFLFFAIEHDTRRVHLLGITEHPSDTWVANAIRAATMDGEPLTARKYWILDNDGKYGAATAAVLGRKAIWTSICAPDMNAIAERWVLSVSTECLNHIVVLNEAMLRRYVSEYVQHYNQERPHQGIGNQPVGPWEAKATGAIVCDQRLSGLLKSFRRAA